MGCNVGELVGSEDGHAVDGLTVEISVVDSVGLLVGIEEDSVDGAGEGRVDGVIEGVIDGH